MNNFIKEDRILLLSGADFVNLNKLPYSTVNKVTIVEFPNEFPWLEGLLLAAEVRRYNSDPHDVGFDRFRYGNFYVSSDFVSDTEGTIHCEIVSSSGELVPFADIILHKKEVRLYTPKENGDIFFTFDYLVEMGVDTLLPKFKSFTKDSIFLIEDKTKDLWLDGGNLKEQQLPSLIGSVLLKYYIPREKKYYILSEKIRGVEYLIFKYCAEGIGNRALMFFINVEGKLEFIPYFNNMEYDWTFPNSSGELDSVTPNLFYSFSEEIFNKYVNLLKEPAKVIDIKLLKEVDKLFTYLTSTNNSVDNFKDLNLAFEYPNFKYYLSMKINLKSRVFLENNENLKLVPDWDSYAVLIDRYLPNKFYEGGDESIFDICLSDIVEDDCPLDAIKVSNPDRVYFIPNDKSKMEEVYLSQLDIEKTLKIKQWRIGQDNIMEHYTELIMTVADLKKGLFYIKPRKDKKDSVFFNDQDFNEIYKLLS